MEKITIGKLAKLAGVGVETIRFYQRKDLVLTPKSTSTIRTYNEEDVEKIIFIKKVQELGFSLSEIKELLELNTKPRQTCGTVKKKTLEKIAEIEEKMEALSRMRESLIKLSCVCDSTQDQVKQYKVQECFNLNQECSC